MPIIYSISGFKSYLIIDKVLYRLEYKTKSISCQFQYRRKRKINRTFKDGVEGYYLVKNGIRKFYSLKKLKHRLKKENYGI
jgi:hypothetical protein